MRNGDREWSTFPETPEAGDLTLQFNASANSEEWTLRLRQQDVKQTWNVTLNDKPLGRLTVNENDMVLYFAVPAGTVRDGANTLKIEQSARRRGPDDIRVGQIALLDRSREKALSEATVSVEVFEGDRLTPCRITVLDENGALHSVGAKSDERLAVRAGVVYCSTGKATFGLPAGRYTIYVGRGFEYGIDSITLTVEAGEQVSRKLTIAREVPTPGYVACDTHVHTLTFSGHGDASIEERMVTLAGEAIEFPIATDHNKHINHDPFARKQDVRKYFTPVVGNEVTTKFGHFNVFPTSAETPIPDYKRTRWEEITESIFATPGLKVAILNHARDLHGGFRPFGPKAFNAATAENLDGWQLRANAMELINSGATQSDALELARDWMSLQNRGLFLTPVGCSDSHDVARHFVGQGRTYIRADDSDVSAIDVEQTVANFVQGRVNASYGLLMQVSVNGKYGPGETVPASPEYEVAIQVLGPSWSKANEVVLYANGEPIKEWSIEDEGRAGVKWSGSLTLPATQDVHLVAIARGPGIEALYWPTAKAYQPDSPDWTSHVVGISGATWIDADGDSRRTSAYEYARRIVAGKQVTVAEAIAGLKGYDSAVATHVAGLLHKRGVALRSAEVRQSLQGATETVQRGFDRFVTAQRDCDLARGR
ncbi:MAG: hypothetical protein CMJ48_05120 [Planctomycetaceae bacterium]|nr:hypothetical protein [Planctomycetaceae bacterium]